MSSPPLLSPGQPDPSAPDPLWVRIAFASPILACALFVIVSDRFSPTEKNWAFGAAGTFLGYLSEEVRLLRGRIARFSLDALVNIAAALGWRVTIKGREFGALVFS